MRLALILLAAGDSRRFGSNKLLYEFMGKPMYQYLTGEIKKLPKDLFSEKIVVSQYPQLLREMEADGYHAVRNEDSALGISHSIHLGLSAVADRSAACCFAVCDQPFLKADTIHALAEGYLSAGRGLGCLCHREVLGNPAIFSSEYREELLALTGDVGGKKVIRRHMEDLYLQEVKDEKELEDMDTLEKARSATAFDAARPDGGQPV